MLQYINPNNHCILGDARCLFIATPRLSNACARLFMLVSVSGYSLPESASTCVKWNSRILCASDHRPNQSRKPPIWSIQASTSSATSPGGWASRVSAPKLAMTCGTSRSRWLRSTSSLLVASVRSSSARLLSSRYSSASSWSWLHAYTSLCIALLLESNLH